MLTGTSIRQVQEFLEYIKDELLIQVLRELTKKGGPCLRLGLILSQTTQAESIASKEAVQGRQTELCRLFFKLFFPL